MSGRRILVTGAAGFIGSHSVDRLLDHGHDVIGVDNFRTGRFENLDCARHSDRFRLVNSDVTDEAAMDRLFREYRFDGLLHLAALVSVPESFKEPALNYRINVAATDILARLCLIHECRRIVFASSAAVYGNAAALPNRESAEPDPVSPYAAAKLASEVLLLGYAASYGLEAVCFRYFNVYGVRQDPSSPYSGVLSIFTDRMRAGAPVTVFGDGEQTRDFVSVHDVAQFNCSAVTAEGIRIGRYNVCTGTEVSLNDVLEICRHSYPDAPAPSYSNAREGDIRHSVGDPQRLEQNLGMRASVPFARGLNALISGKLL